MYRTFFYDNVSRKGTIKICSQNERTESFKAYTDLFTRVTIYEHVQFTTNILYKHPTRRGERAYFGGTKIGFREI